MGYPPTGNIVARWRAETRVGRIFYRLLEDGRVLYQDYDVSRPLSPYVWTPRKGSGAVSRFASPEEFESYFLKRYRHVPLYRLPTDPDTTKPGHLFRRPGTAAVKDAADTAFAWVLMGVLVVGAILYLVLAMANDMNRQGSPDCITRQSKVGDC